jgi:hypothetical protein
VILCILAIPELLVTGNLIGSVNQGNLCYGCLMFNWPNVQCHDTKNQWVKLPARGSLTIFHELFIVSMLWAKTSRPESAKEEMTSRSPWMSEVKHLTIIPRLSS